MKAAFIFLTMVLAYNMAFAQAGSNNTANKQGGAVINNATWSYQSEGPVDGWEIIDNRGNFSYGKGGLFTAYFEGQSATTFISIYTETLGPDGGVIQRDYLDSNGYSWTDTGHSEPALPSEKGTLHKPSGVGAWTGTWTKTGSVEYKYYGGGQGKGQSIYPVSGSAKKLIAGDVGSVNGADIPFNQIRVDGHTLWTDGHAFHGDKAGADFDLPIDLTSKPPMAEVHAGAYECHPHIEANDINIEIGTPEFCVGQKITFKTVWDIAPPSVIDIMQHWTLPGKYVNEQYFYSDYCLSYRQNPDLLTNTSPYCWYVNKPGGAAVVGQNIHFQNGQYLSVASDGSFNIFRPTKIRENMCNDSAVLNMPIQSPCLYITNIGNRISLGNADGGYARFWAAYQAKPGDNFRELQIVQTHRKWGYDETDSGSDWWNDGSGLKLGSLSPADATGLGIVQQTDKFPAVFLEAPETEVNDIFKTYFQYMPSSGGIWVTLGKINWSWVDHATYNGYYWIIPDGTVSSPQYADDDSFPLWEANTPH